VVILQEEKGCHFFFSSDRELSACQILEAMADRWAVEQTFRELKQVWGAGEQQLRDLWANIGAWHLHLWLYTLVELWAWNKPAEELCDRGAPLGRPCPSAFPCRSAEGVAASNPGRGIFDPYRQWPNTTENSSNAEKTAASRALTSNFLAKSSLNYSTSVGLEYYFPQLSRI
jgi:hypothetical protein